jgi:hypothetical protein
MNGYCESAAGRHKRWSGKLGQSSVTNIVTVAGFVKLDDRSGRWIQTDNRTSWFSRSPRISLNQIRTIPTDRSSWKRMVLMHGFFGRNPKHAWLSFPLPGNNFFSLRFLRCLLPQMPDGMLIAPRLVVRETWKLGLLN